MAIFRKTWIVLAAGHLLLVLCGAGGSLPTGDHGPAAQAVRWYATMSGADSGYGFFAPEVGSPYRARFMLKDAEGKTWPDTFDQANTIEARLRLTGIVDGAFMTGAADESPEWRNHLIRSWSAMMFRRHPGAVSLTVIVEVYDLPTMAEHRAGKLPTWQSVYRAEVQRHSDANSQETRK